jgi:MmyB-like transcription regulator ligand binding domain
MDPKRRRLYRDWPDMAAAAAGWLRANYASHIGDAGYEDLIQTLYQASPEFVRIWDARQTISVALSPPVRLDTPRFGNLDVHSVRFLVPGGPGHILIFLPPANATTAAVFAKEARRHLSDAVRSPRRAARP